VEVASKRHSWHLCLRCVSRLFTKHSRSSPTRPPESHRRDPHKSVPTTPQPGAGATARHTTQARALHKHMPGPRRRSSCAFHSFVVRRHIPHQRTHESRLLHITIMQTARLVKSCNGEWNARHAHTYTPHAECLWMAVRGLATHDTAAPPHTSCRTDGAAHHPLTEALAWQR
jgi:hypothetical protein